MRKKLLATLCAMVFIITSTVSGFALASNKLESEANTLLETKSKNDITKDNSRNKRYLIKYKDIEGKKKGIKKILKNGGKIKKKFDKLQSVSAELSSEELENLKNDTDIAFIEQDFKVNISSESTPLGIQQIKAPVLHKGGIKGLGVKVAVFDTGISNHEDLYVKNGVSFVEGVESFNDNNGHGTHVAGIISALENNKGVIGVAPNVEIYSVKVIDKYGSGNYSSVIEGIEWAIDNDINIINMSFGGTEYSDILNDAINKAYESGILIVASSGNKGGDKSKNTILYPAKFKNVIAVGAVDSDLKRASFSSTGSELELVAPGVNVNSTLNNGLYGTKSGTSMASPHTVGVASILLDKDNTLTNYEVRGILQASSKKVGHKNLCGYGFIDAKNALEEYNNFKTNNENYDRVLIEKNKDKKTKKQNVKAPFQFELTKNKTMFKVTNKKLDFESIKVSVFEKGNKNVLLSKKLTPNDKKIELKGLELYKNYTYNVKIQKAQEVIDSYFGEITLLDSKSEKGLKLITTVRDFNTTDNQFIKINDGVLNNSSENSINSDMEIMTVEYESEKNDIKYDANYIYDDDDVYGKISSNIDVDCFRIKFYNAGTANFWLGNIPSGCDYDIYLSEYTGGELARSWNGSNSDELIQYTVDANKTYYVEVVGYDGSHNIYDNYHLRVKNYASSRDRYETNNTKDQAYDLASYTGGKLIDDANLDSENDVDYFKISSGSAIDLDITLSDIPSNCDYELILYNSSGVEIEGSRNWYSADENISKKLLAPGVYFIQIYSYEGSSTDSYKLSVRIEYSSVAELRIYSCDYTTTGHSYVSIKNVTDRTIPGGRNIDIGHLTDISVGKTITVGAWGQVVTPEGLWYNLESFQAKYIDGEDDFYRSNVSLSKTLNSRQLYLINEFIIENEDWNYNIFTNNCTEFATKLWNVDSLNTLMPVGYTPLSLVLTIKNKPNYEESIIPPYDYAAYVIINGEPVLKKKYPF